MNQQPHLGGLDWEKSTKEAKRSYIRRMFDVIASRYDSFTRMFSFGMDAGWKRELLGLAANGDTRCVLDLGCGTGDLLDAIVDVRSQRGIGIDASPAMCVNASARFSGRSALVTLGDITCMGIADASVDLVTAGYAFRNVVAIGLALNEVRRVLRAGGQLLVLDFYSPGNVLWRRLFLFYLRIAGSVFGVLLHGEAAVYKYIAGSIERYMTGDAFAALLEEHGFRIAARRRHLLGGIWLHVAVRSINAPS